MDGPVSRPPDLHVAHSESIDPEQVKHHWPFVVVRRLVRVPVITVAVNSATPLDNDVACMDKPMCNHIPT